MTWEALIEDIQAWQHDTFPSATPESAAEHLRREALELLAYPYDPGEQSDVFILLTQIAMLTGVDLYDAVCDKMAVNKARRWKHPDADGVVEHVEA